ncbi:hypothetical protein [Parerythrobacter aestuarii]|uniref:hypothetical protein n=1 Tax=Parerythrobacter aestuarii TaxID=3020909 RepID=UPI0024DE2BC1|nr:hypothetical protein [Parerythrobacter aestuarii]
MRHLVLLSAALLALAGCGTEPADAPDQSGPGEAPVATGEPQAPTGFASVYTDLDLDSCELLELETEQGSSASWRCPGFGDTPLLVEEGDGRFDLDAGVDDSGFQTIGAFNDLNDTIEWRLLDGQPVAVIFRYRDVSMETKGRTVLAVEKVGRQGAPGCRMAQIAGNTPEANQRARDFADAAVDFSCGTSEMALVGEAR